MSLWKIAWRNMQQRSLSSTLTAISMALGVALVVAVLVIHSVVEESFSRSAQGYHLIVGAKGGKLQLVLNTVYHLSQPIENIPYSYYKEFTDGRFAAYVKVAIPYCLGDNYKGYRVVGTVPDLFEKLDFGSGKHYKFQQGRNFKRENYFEAVIGSLVANNTGLKVDDSFVATHGITAEGHAHEENKFKVVGILEPTGTANDRAVFVNIEGFYLMPDHAKPLPAEKTGAKPLPAAEDGAKPDGADPDEHQGEVHHDENGGQEHQPLPEAQREVTAILVLVNNDLYSQSIFTQINEGQVAQAVFPTREVAMLFDGIVGPLRMVLLVLAVLVIVVAGIGIMVSIYNSMSDRKRDIAIMRALGASRNTVMAVILLESILLSLCGGLGGLILGHGAIAAVNPLLLEKTGVSIEFLNFASYEWAVWNTVISVPYELILVPGLIILASVAGFLPALGAYRTDVAKALSAAA